MRLRLRIRMRLRMLAPWNWRSQLEEHSTAEIACPDTLVIPDNSELRHLEIFNLKP